MADGHHRQWRISPWHGTWRNAPWQKPFVFGIEDPLDATDNTARAVGTSNALDASSQYIAHVFRQSAEAMQTAGMCSSSGPNRMITQELPFHVAEQASQGELLLLSRLF